MRNAAPQPVQGVAANAAEPTTDPVGRLLRIADVCKDVGLSRAMIYRCIRRNDRPFPRPVKIGYASRWRERDVIAWKRTLAGEGP